MIHGSISGRLKSSSFYPPRRRLKSGELCVDDARMRVTCQTCLIHIFHIEWRRLLQPRNHGTLYHLKLQEWCSLKTLEFSIHRLKDLISHPSPNHPGARWSFVTLSLWLCSWWCCRRLGSILMHQCVTAWRSDVRLYFSSPGIRVGCSLGWRSMLGNQNPMWESWVKIGQTSKKIKAGGKNGERFLGKRQNGFLDAS